MSRVLRVDESVPSERLGTALARLWTVNGLALKLVDVVDACGGIRDSDLCICSFTTERPANPGMTEDGHVMLTVVLFAHRRRLLRDVIGPVRRMLRDVRNHSKRNQP